MSDRSLTLERENEVARKVDAVARDLMASDKDRATKVAFVALLARTNAEQANAAATRRNLTLDEIIAEFYR